ncbi:hypothetical protein PSV08DRAFT_384093 [Bipolaris maydis]|nr:hypothetical protein J3E74DRAFT_435462 [Bipolaris maydis]KAJ6274596.1 hypothetical protein PSV08DRAFT_384093 [Bipolaris maydis]KAJ6286123.1 hypothetical protein J3E71DRAFT_374593 [Bipolaris maydis]
MQRVRGALLRWCWCCCTSTRTRAAADYVDGKECPRWEEAARVKAWVQRGEETASDVKLHMGAPRRIRRAHGPLSLQGVFTVASRVRWQRPRARPLWEIGEPYLLLSRPLLLLCPRLLPANVCLWGLTPSHIVKMHSNTPN